MRALTYFTRAEPALGARSDSMSRIGLLPPLPSQNGGALGLYNPRSHNQIGAKVIRSGAVKQSVSYYRFEVCPKRKREPNLSQKMSLGAEHIEQAPLILGSRINPPYPKVPFVIAEERTDNGFRPRNP